jgi:hypothetical protein
MPTVNRQQTAENRKKQKSIKKAKAKNSAKISALQFVQKIRRARAEKTEHRHAHCHCQIHINSLSVWFPTLVPYNNTLHFASSVALSRKGFLRRANQGRIFPS